MDQAFLYGGVVAASLVTLLVVTLLFFTRKTVSFEEAVLQPRKQQQTAAAAATKSKKIDVKKEKKSEKRQKKTTISKKEDEVDGESEPVVATATEPDQHVEFSVANEVVPLDEEHDQQLAKRQVHADERPKKPILLKKSDQSEPAADVRSQAEIGRCNSFETVHPKDEYELIKSQLTRDQQKPGISEEDVRVAEKRFRDVKKKTKSTNKIAPAEKLTVTQLVDIVKSVALSEEESQLLVNEILNKESETWSQKNDPLAQLKKSVEEKEAQLRTEAENREALKIRLHELRQELAAHKVQSQSTRTQTQQLQQELAKLQSSMRTAADQHRAELQSLQAKLRNEYNVKAAATLTRLQDENSRLKELVQKLEVDRAALDAIPRLQNEADQLRGDRQQKEVTITNLTLQNEDLLREKSALKEQLNSLAANKQQDEFVAKKQISDLQDAVREREVATQNAADELSLARDRLSHVTSDLEQLQKQHAAELTRLSSESQRISDENHSLSLKLTDSEKLIHQIQAQLQQTEQRLSDVTSDSSHKAAAATAELEALRKQYEELLQNSGSESDVRVREAEDRLSLLSDEKQVLIDEVSQQKNQLVQLQREKDSVMQFLNSSFSHLNVSQEDLLPAVESVIQELKLRITSEPEIGSQLEGVRIQNEHLQQEIRAYKQSLTQTDESLKQIESRALDQEKRWNEQLQSERDHHHRVSQENETLLAENQSLKQTIKELQSIQTTVVDMEDKLKDLQSKLRGEETAKQDLSSKFDEVSSADVREASSRASTMREELDRTNKQLQELTEQRQKVDEMLKQMDDLQQQLDREKKTGKELQAQNVKLRSLVKIGEDSLKAEMRRNDDLVNQLKLKNGQVHGTAVSTPCLTTNGNDQDSVLSSTSSSSLNREVSTDTDTTGH